MAIKKILLFVLCIVMVTVSLSGCGSKTKNQKEIVLLDGQFSEIRIIMHMAKILIEENTDLKVSIHDSMNTVAAGQSLAAKEVDLYVSYDGTLLTTLLGRDPKDVPAGQSLFTYAKQVGAKEKGLTLLDKFGFENTYALAVKEDYAQKHNIRTISDLVPYAKDLVFGAEHEFFDEKGSVRFKPFTAYYGLVWKDSKSLDMGLKYSAMDSNNIDVTIVYSTDGLNKRSSLRILEDDRAFFPEYFAAFMFRDTLFEEYKDTAPNLKEVLAKLNGKIDNNTMIELNYAVDALKEKPSDVARKFLKGKM